VSVEDSRLTRFLQAFDNPLVAKDGISRMRSWRAPLALTVYLGVLGLCGYSFFSILVFGNATNKVGGSAGIGSAVFAALTFVQLVLIALFAPALAAGAISGERERQTLDVLLVSRVSAFGIVWGKLVASLAYLLLLILTALPLFAAVFLFGGIDFEQFLLAQVITIMTALTLGSISLFASAVFQRSLPATVTSYSAAFLLVVGTFVAGTLLSYLYFFRVGAATYMPIHPLVFSNPFYAIGMELYTASGGGINAGRLFQAMFFTSGDASWGPIIQPWQLSLLFETVLTVLSIAGAVRIVKGRRAAPLRRRETSS
jgi:ABC-type transport system involved in multi-copper enzyme maturation permease subunit